MVEVWSRRRFASSLGLATLVAAWPGGASARPSSIVVPTNLQAKLAAKVAAFDRNLMDRCDATVRIAIAEVPGNASSGRAAARLKKALESSDLIAGRPVEVETARYEQPESFAARCLERRVGIVYLTPGLAEGGAAIADAFSGTSMLTVSSVPAHVERSAVVAFDLNEGKAEILVHLGRAGAQAVDFKASFLRLATIVDT